MDTLGSHIRSIRKRKGFTLKVLSDKSGISISYLSETERDIVNPSYKTMQCIAKGLGITVPELLNTNGVYQDKLTADNKLLKEVLSAIQELLDLLGDNHDD